MNGCEQEVVIKRLNPILRGFANYYKGVVSKETFDYVKSRIWQYLWRWAKRRHPNKNTFRGTEMEIHELSQKNALLIERATITLPVMADLEASRDHVLFDLNPLLSLW